MNDFLWSAYQRNCQGSSLKIMSSSQILRLHSLLIWHQVPWNVVCTVSLPGWSQETSHGFITPLKRVPNNDNLQSCVPELVHTVTKTGLLHPWVPVISESPLYNAELVLPFSQLEFSVQCWLLGMVCVECWKISNFWQTLQLPLSGWLCVESFRKWCVEQAVCSECDMKDLVGGTEGQAAFQSLTSPCLREDHLFLSLHGPLRLLSLHIFLSWK
jgi:hypothetical protein